MDSVMEDEPMFKLSLSKSTNYVNVASLVALIVTLSACAQTRVKPTELSQEVPQSAFNDENWDTRRSDSNFQTRPNAFKDRAPAKRRARTSVAGY